MGMLLLSLAWCWWPSLSLRIDIVDVNSAEGEC